MPSTSTRRPRFGRLSRWARVAVFTGVTVYALAAFAPTPARACGRGNGYGLESLAYLAVGTAVVFGATDVGFVAHDVYEASKGERVGTTFAVVETIIAVPQILIFYALASDRSVRTPAILIGLVPTGMFIHGVATLSAPQHDTNGSGSAPLTMTSDGAALTAIGHF